MHPHELVKVCVDELRLHTCSTDPYVRVRHHALCSVLLRGGGVRSCALIGAYCYYHMGQGFAKDEGTDVLWLPLDTLIRHAPCSTCIFHSGLLLTHQVCNELLRRTVTNLWGRLAGRSSMTGIAN